jgi:hypothetical protein
MLLWLSIRFLSRLLLGPFPVACCEVVVADEASFTRRIQGHDQLAPPGGGLSISDGSWPTAISFRNGVIHFLVGF